MPIKLIMKDGKLIIGTNYYLLHLAKVLRPYAFLVRWSLVVVDPTHFVETGL